MHILGVCSSDASLSLEKEGSLCDQIPQSQCGNLVAVGLCCCGFFVVVILILGETGSHCVPRTDLEPEDQAGLTLKEIQLPLSVSLPPRAEIKGMHHHTQLYWNYFIYPREDKLLPRTPTAVSSSGREL